MLALSFDSVSGSTKDLVAIHARLYNGRKSSCHCIGCKDLTIDSYIFDKQFLSGDRLYISFYQEDLLKEEKCIEFIEKEFENDFSKSNITSKHKLEEHIFNNILVEMNDEKIYIKNIEEYDCIKIHFLMRKGGKSAIGLISGYKKDNPNVKYWLRREFDANNSEVTLSIN